eukprot:4801190-Alexandrium_andersonii.AAC.1
MWNIMRSASQRLTESECGGLLQAQEAVLFGCNFLRAEANDLGTARWGLLPKHHQLLELLVHARSSKLNPAYHSCWADEDFVGRVSRLAKACHPDNMSAATVRRWLVTDNM